MVADYIKPPPSKEYLEARATIETVLDMMTEEHVIELANRIRTQIVKAVDSTFVN